MRTFIIGRSRFADIVLADASVSRRHAELVVTDDGRHHLTDCRSEGGTWRRTPETGSDPEAPDGWQPLRQAFIRADEPLRLGSYLCSAAALVRQLPQGHGDGSGGGSGTGGDGGGRWRPGLDRPGGIGRLGGRVERDPATGEIIRKRL